MNESKQQLIFLRIPMTFNDEPPCFWLWLWLWIGHGEIGLSFTSAFRSGTRRSRVQKCSQDKERWTSLPLSVALLRAVVELSWTLSTLVRHSLDFSEVQHRMEASELTIFTLGLRITLIRWESSVLQLAYELHNPFRRC